MPGPKLVLKTHRKPTTQEIAASLAVDLRRFVDRLDEVVSALQELESAPKDAA